MITNGRGALVKSDVRWAVFAELPERPGDGPGAVRVSQWAQDEEQAKYWRDRMRRNYDEGTHGPLTAESRKPGPDDL